jgi:hypothetical protein
VRGRPILKFDFRKKKNEMSGMSIWSTARIQYNQRLDFVGLDRVNSYMLQHRLLLQIGTLSRTCQLKPTREITFDTVTRVQGPPERSSGENSRDIRALIFMRVGICHLSKAANSVLW